MGGSLGISRGQAKPRGSRVRVPAGTGAGRPGDTPDPCIPESVTQPVHTRQTPVAVFFLLYNLAGCTTPTTPLFGADDSHEGPQRPTAPTKADEEGKGSPQRGKRAQTTVWRRLGH